jgi:hypothetical protein
MTRYFAGPDDVPWKAYLPPNASVNEAHLVDAKRKMKEYFDVVCFLHDLPSCANQILSAFQIDYTVAARIDLSGMTTNKNSAFKTRERPNKLDSDSLLKFQNTNQLDLDLYNWALSTYEYS